MTTSDPATIHLRLDGCPHNDEDTCKATLKQNLDRVVQAAATCDVDLEGGWTARLPDCKQEYTVEIWEVQREE